MSENRFKRLLRRKLMNEYDRPAKKQKRNKHHLTPRCRTDQPFHGNDAENLLLYKLERHELYHKIFGVRTLEETIALLQRLKRAKRRF